MIVLDKFGYRVILIIRELCIKLGLVRLLRKICET